MSPQNSTGDTNKGYWNVVNELKEVLKTGREIIDTGLVWFYIRRHSSKIHIKNVWTPEARVGYFKYIIPKLEGAGYIEKHGLLWKLTKKPIGDPIGFSFDKTTLKK